MVYFVRMRRSFSYISLFLTSFFFTYSVINFIAHLYFSFFV